MLPPRGAIHTEVRRWNLAERVAGGLQVGCGDAFVRFMAGVLAFFVSFIAFTKIMTAVWPAPGMVAAKAATKVMRQAPARAVSEAVAGVYVKMLEEIEARDFPRLGVATKRNRAYYEEELLLAGASIEVVGMVHDRNGKLVLSGPVNGAMQVRLWHEQK